MDNFMDVINEWVEKVDRDIDRVLQTVVLLVGRSVVTLSPVDTGRFKGNWQMSIDETIDNSLVRYDPEGTQTLNDMARVANRFTAGQMAYIQNHVLYGTDLELGLYNGPTAKVTDDGFSRQAPAGMVSVTEAKFLSIVNEAVKLTI
jgi:hypothetical protein